jgi:RNA polymerase sigma factor (sigma-70 family)
MLPQTPDVTWTDEDLVRECLAGNESAWAALVAKYTKLVYSLPLKYGLPPDEAADVFQAVWADLYLDLAKLERVEGLRSWLSTAAARRSLLRKKHRQKSVDLTSVAAGMSAEAPDPMAAREEADREQKLREAIAKLPERCQRLVHMLFFEQPPKPYAQVAEELGLAEGSIGFIRSRCLGKLRAILEEQTG